MGGGADRAARVVAALLRLPLLLCLAAPVVIGVAATRAPRAAALALVGGALAGLGVGALAGAAGWRGLGLWAAGGGAAGAAAFLVGLIAVQARRATAPSKE